ncbi:AAA domain-containing protein [Phthorimaea operculella]|nr:AAA domain-containing protein [Phthorimaea operculella]
MPASLSAVGWAARHIQVIVAATADWTLRCLKITYSEAVEIATTRVHVDTMPASLAAVGRAALHVQGIVAASADWTLRCLKITYSEAVEVAAARVPVDTMPASLVAVRRAALHIQVIVAEAADWTVHFFKSPAGSTGPKRFRHIEDAYPVPNDRKSIFANGLEVHDNASQSKKDLAEKIRNIFATGVTEENYVEFFHNLLWYEETIVKIDMKKYDMKNVALQRNERLGTDCYYDLEVPNIAKLSLKLGDKVYVKPRNSEDCFEATIKGIKKEVVSLELPQFKFRQYCDTRMKFDIEFMSSRISLERMHSAVEAMKLLSNMNRVFPVLNVDVTAPYKIQKYYNKLMKENPEQRSAVEHIVGGTSGTAPYLLHGPPGTGKTVTIVEAILQLLTKDSTNRILVCTESNMAADHIAVSLVKYARSFLQKKFLLRACSKTRDWKTLPKSLQQYTNRTLFLEDEGQLDLNPVADRKREMELEMLMFRTHSIVVTTLSYAATYTKHCTTRPITHLFIDEASQASEPACLIPITGLLSPRGSLTLAGDPQQLGPVIMSRHAKELGLGLSLMERLMTKCELYQADRNDPNYTVMLRNNFRSDPAVLKIPNKLFYKSQLKALAAADPLSSVDILGERTSSRAIVFHGVLSHEQRTDKSPSFSNYMELELVQEYIKKLIRKHKVLPEDIGVVTPYILQVSKIKNWLRGTAWSDRIEVGSVEAFQGKEKRVIIISTVRSGSQMGFLVDDQRFNVALTRAKAKAIVIGNPLCLQKDVKWRTYMKLCRKYGTYCGHDPETQVDELADLFGRLLRKRTTK